MTFLTHLECSLCGKTYDADRLWQVCPDCGRPLLARYDLDAARRLGRERLIGPEPSLWRYRALLPVRDDTHIVTLGEGFTPLLPARRLGAELGMPHLYIKEESLNPTGSFKARGLAVAVSRARELGGREMVIPSAGNAAGAAAAYAARAGLRLHVFMPRDVPAPFLAECRALGAEVTLVDGLITDCGREARRLAQEHGWFDLSTLKEPYRLEGKKTMGYELAEQMNWDLPDVIIYPTGGGTGLVGMWKAFEEMAELGWMGEPPPAHGDGPEHGLRAHCPGVPRRGGVRRPLGGRADRRGGAAGAGGGGGLPHPAGTAGQWRDRRRRPRRGADRGPAVAGPDGGGLRLPGGRRDPGRAEGPAGRGLDRPRRAGGPLQHRQRAEVPGMKPGSGAGAVPGWPTAMPSATP